jgi:formylglycine-generating enzyme required for sulfatase activity
MRNWGELNAQPVTLPDYCIDIYEFPNASGRVPAVSIGFAAAKNACKKKKKRICSEEEWEKSCKGTGNLRFPYGNNFSASACSTEKEDGADGAVSPSGSFSGCRSKYGAADMSGNVEEWAVGKDGGPILKGGAADRPDWSCRCASRRKAGTPAFIGLRCCADPQ